MVAEAPSLGIWHNTFKMRRKEVLKIEESFFLMLLSVLSGTKIL
jgi:hypothetical protein